MHSLEEGVSAHLFSARIAGGYMKESSLLKGLAWAKEMVTVDPSFRKELKELTRLYFEKLVNSPQTQQRVRQVVGDIVERWKAQSLLEKSVEYTKGIWGLWIREKVIQALPGLSRSLEQIDEPVDQWLDRLPELIARNQGNIEAVATSLIVNGLELMDVEGIIRGQLGKMDEGELKKLLTGNINAELTFIQTSGGCWD